MILIRMFYLLVNGTTALLILSLTGGSDDVVAATILQTVITSKNTPSDADLRLQIRDCRRWPGNNPYSMNSMLCANGMGLR